jgi:DNA-directed RNA polymerase subunit L
MTPRIQNLKETDHLLTFTLSGVNVSLANAIRRTILSDIPIAVFKTSPYEENKAVIRINTTRLNNEIIKQRLSCIPIHIKDLSIPLQNYLLEVNVENTSDTIMYVTTEHFKIKNVETGNYLSDKDTRNIFPPNDQTGYFIDFVRLRPKISEDVPGEKIELTCEFSIDTAKTDGMFNCVSTCSYGCTVDPDLMKKELDKKMQEWRDNDLTKEEIEFESKNWKLLDGLRFIKKDSFDFQIQTLGVFTNNEIVHKSCDIIIKKLKKMYDDMETDDLEISVSKNTMKHCFDILLKNEDYTIGKVLEFMLFSKYFEDAKLLTFCGFKKMHPHDDDSIVRIAFKDPIEKNSIKQYLKNSIEDAFDVYRHIKKEI